MWVVRVGDSAYVRSARRPSGQWYRRALRDDAETHRALDAAYHVTYERYGPQIVGSVVGPAAAAVTLRLDSTH